MILQEAYKKGNLQFENIPDLKIGFTRFIASMVMHVVVSEEIQNGLSMMKYSANHWWKFSSPRLAWMSGLLQLTAMTCIAVINYFVITISDNVLDLAKDFTALMVIADFDDFMGKPSETYASVPEIAHDCCVEDEYEELLKREVTTSIDAGRDGCLKLQKDEVFEQINLRR